MPLSAFPRVTSLGCYWVGQDFGGLLTHQCVPGISYRGGHCAGFLRPCVWNTTPTPKPVPPSPTLHPHAQLTPPFPLSASQPQMWFLLACMWTPFTVGKEVAWSLDACPWSLNFLKSGSGALMLSIVFMAPGIQKALGKYLLEE